MSCVTVQRKNQDAGCRERRGGGKGEGGSAVFLLSKEGGPATEGGVYSGIPKGKGIGVEIERKKGRENVAKRGDFLYLFGESTLPRKKELMVPTKSRRHDQNRKGIAPFRSRPFNWHNDSGCAKTGKKGCDHKKREKVSGARSTEKERGVPPMSPVKRGKNKEIRQIKKKKSADEKKKKGGGNRRKK